MIMKAQCITWQQYENINVKPFGQEVSSVQVASVCACSLLTPGWLDLTVEAQITSRRFQPHARIQP